MQVIAIEEINRRWVSRPSPLARTAIYDNFNIWAIRDLWHWPQSRWTMPIGLTRRQRSSTAPFGEIRWPVPMLLNKSVTYTYAWPSIPNEGNAREKRREKKDKQHPWPTTFLTIAHPVSHFPTKDVVSDSTVRTYRRGSPHGEPPRVQGSLICILATPDSCRCAIRSPAFFIYAWLRTWLICDSSTDNPCNS